MWQDAHFVEEAERRMNARIREAEQWRLARQAQGKGRTQGQSLGTLFELVATTLRQRLATPPRTQEKYC